VTASPAEPEPEDGPPPRQGEPHGNLFDRGPAPEALAAGFTHRDPGQHGTGFAAGGAADALPPGLTLAGLAEQASAHGLGSLDDDELAGLLCARRRLSSWAAAMEVAVITEFARRRAAAGLRAIEHLDDEIAALLTLTGRSASRLTGIAASLARLPRTTAALQAGQIDWPRAVVIADETCCLSDKDAAAVEEQVMPAAPGQTTGQLRAAIRRAMLAIDAEAAIKRRKKAEKDARVETWNETAGTSALAGRDLPPAHVIAADQHIDALARWLKAHGAEETLDQLRAKVFIALLTGQRADALLPTPTSAASDMSGRSGWPVGLCGSVNLTMPLTTWLGLATEPGEAAGLGALDADVCRDLAAALAMNPGSRWCLTLTGLAGRAAAHGCARTGPPGSGPPESDPPGTGPPGTGPPGTGPPRSGPPGTGPPGSGPSGTGPPGTGPPGTGPPGTGPPGTGPPGTGPPGRDLGSWLAGIRLSSVEAGTCTHPRETSAYRPSPTLRHLINIRDRTCFFPPCRRQAVKCDQDHTVPFEQGGRTCECNIGAGCRRHHRAKQAPGWHVDQTEPGQFIWTLPSGRQLTAVPGRYPA